VVATKNTEKIAIEIETGKSNYKRNIQQNLGPKYDKIVVAATDKKALKKVELDLAQVYKHTIHAHETSSAQRRSQHPIL
jgi:hypothetical protein